MFVTAWWAKPISFHSAFVVGLYINIEDGSLPEGELGERVINSTTSPGAVE